MKPRIGFYAWLVLLVAILAMGAACSKAAADGDVSSEVQNKINADSGLQGKQLTVQTAAGVVTLSGTVDNDAQRTAASRYAASVSGVKEVVNNLQVAAPAAAAPQDEPAPTPAPVQRASKPRPSMPRERPAPRSEPIASAAPVPAPVQDSRPAPAPVVSATPPPPPPVRRVTVPSGTNLAIRLVDELDSETAQPGQGFKATLDSPLSVDGDVVLPAGYDVQGHVVDVKSAGKFAGRSELVLQLDRISVGGKSYTIQTDQYHREGSSRGKNTAAKVGTGAAIGAIIGGIAGGGKGAAIGAAAGGGIGGGVQAATKGQQIRLPSETVLNFSLQSSLTVTPTSDGPNSGRHKLEAPAPAPAPAQTPAPPSSPENLGPQ
ncbi:MAG: BON domain-containing protein [Acidobacteria bacterium]|nr:BON domain-containing protein [Acidobacteriota bacterium]